MPRTSPSLAQILIATWGLAQVLYLLGSAIYRLTPLAFEPWIDGTLSPVQKLLWIGFVGANAYLEGYRGFQLRFSPRVVGRATHLAAHPKPLHVLLALPFCMSLFHATRRQMIARWIFIVALYAVIALVHHVPQPWRGIIDGGVVVGLAWGFGSVLYFFGLYLTGRPHPTANDLPDVEPAAA